MGMTIRYVRITEHELKPIVAGGASNIVDALLAEYHDPYSRKRGEAKEFWGNNGSYNSRARQVDMLCSHYAMGLFTSEDDLLAQEIELSKEDLLREMKQRGLHFWLDINKEYRNLHPLLPGKHSWGIPEPNDLLSLALYGENDVPKGSLPTGGSDEHDSEGYGPPRYVQPARVQDIAAFFKKTRYGDVLEKHGLDPKDSDGSIFDFIKDFYLQAAECKDAVFVFFL